MLQGLMKDSNAVMMRDRELAGHGLFGCQTITMVATLYLLRTIALGKQEKYEADDDEICDSANTMLTWLNGAMAFALTSLILQFTVNMRCGSTLEHEFYLYCKRNNFEMFSFHRMISWEANGSNRDGSETRVPNKFGKNSVDGSFELNPSLASRADESAETKKEKLKGKTTQICEVRDLDPCVRRFNAPKMRVGSFVFNLLDIGWNIFGIVTVALATTEDCQNSEPRLFWTVVTLVLAFFVMSIIVLLSHTIVRKESSKMKNSSRKNIHKSKSGRDIRDIPADLFVETTQENTL